MALRRSGRSIVMTAAEPLRSYVTGAMGGNSRTSQPLHMEVAGDREHSRCRSLLARVAPALPGPRAFYQPTRRLSSAALRSSLRRSSQAWRAERRITATAKNTTTPSEKKVMIRSSVSPTMPSPLSPAKSTISFRSRIQGERYPLAGRAPIVRLHRRDPEGKQEQIRVRPRSGRHQARPLSLLLGRLSDGLWVHPGDAVARRRSARRDGLRLRADLPRLHDRREAAGALPDGGRSGHRRQVPRRTVDRPRLEHAREPRRGAEPAPERDRPLLHRLQAARAQTSRRG